MIEILLPWQAKPIFLESKLSFKDMQALVNGYVEAHSVMEDGKVVDVLCNEDGIMLELPFNRAATARFSGKLNVGAGARGVWLVLSGEHILADDEEGDDE